MEASSREQLAALATEHGWQPTLPVADARWAWLYLWHRQMAVRLSVEWADDLEGGCTAHCHDVHTAQAWPILAATDNDLRALITEPQLVADVARMFIDMPVIREADIDLREAS